MTDTPGNYGGDQPSRLDRIEATLARIAESQERTQAIAESNARSIQAWEAKFETQDRDIDRLALVSGDVENGTRTLAIAVRDIFSLIIDRLEAVEARLPSDGENDQN